MNETAGICWYKVHKCGYYRTRRTPQPEFGDLSSTLSDLQRWSQGKQLAETQTIGQDAGEGEAEQLPVYLLDVRANRDNWLITLWNQTPAVEGQVASVRRDAVVGRADVVMNDLAPGTIPGFATYFYVVPSINAVAGIRFQHLAFGHLGMRRYLSGFVRQYSRHVVWSEDPGPEGGLEILGYARAPEDEPLHLSPYFKSAILKQGGERELLVRRARDVRRVVRRSLLQAGRRPDRALWQNLLQRVGLAEPPAAPPAVKLEYEMSVRLEPAEMRELADQWDDEAAEAEDWEDIGFILRGEQTPHWLSKSVARLKIDLDIERDSAEIVNPESLLAQLVRHRRDITGAIREPG